MWARAQQCLGLLPVQAACRRGELVQCRPGVPASPQSPKAARQSNSEAISLCQKTPARLAARLPTQLCKHGGAEALHLLNVLGFEGSLGGDVSRFSDHFRPNLDPPFFSRTMGFVLQCRPRLHQIAAQQTNSKASDANRLRPDCLQVKALCSLFAK